MYLLERLTAVAGARPASRRAPLSGKLERRREVAAKDEDGLKEASGNSGLHSDCSLWSCQTGAILRGYVYVRAVKSVSNKS